MAVRAVLRYPHPTLKQTARPLDRSEEALIERVAADIVETMRANQRCVGLAAPQLDEPVRMVAVDVSEHPRAPEHNGLLVLVNPRIVAADGSEVAREGCLSVPQLTANVRRSTSIDIEALDADGGERVIRSVGFEARCLQHEIDHLDGILFLDRVDSLRTDVFRRKRYA
jgi:peptide deformylase